MYFVYWIYFWENEDIYRSGYVGITNNWPNRKQKHSKRFGKFNYKIIFTGTLEQAAALEFHLRPTFDIGLNKLPGGLHYMSIGPMTGRKHDQETIDKIKASNIGKNKGKRPQLGKHHSEATKERLRQTSKARRHKPESKAKVSEALRKRERKPETFAKISAAMTLRYQKLHAEIDAFIANGTLIDFKQNHHSIETMALADAEAPHIEGN